jgi:WD40 repeat protein
VRIAVLEPTTIWEDAHPRRCLLNAAEDTLTLWYGGTHLSVWLWEEQSTSFRMHKHLSTSRENDTEDLVYSLSAVCFGKQALAYVAVARRAGSVRFWCPRSFEIGFEMHTEHGVRCIESLGTFFAMGSLKVTGSIALHSAENGKLLRTLFGHDWRVLSLQWVGGYLLSSGIDGTVRCVLVGSCLFVVCYSSVRQSACACVYVYA